MSEHRIIDIWGERTPHAGGTAWPGRVDRFLAGGVTEAGVGRWVRSACLLCSNGCGLEIAVAGGRIAGVRGLARDRVSHGRARSEGTVRLAGPAARPADHAADPRGRPAGGDRLGHRDVGGGGPVPGVAGGLDAARLGIGEGDIVKVTSRRGSIEAPARISGVREGVVFAPWHYGGSGGTAANDLTLTAWDPVSKQPEFKVAAVSVQRVRAGDGPAPAPVTTASAPVHPLDAAKAGPEWDLMHLYRTDSERESTERKSLMQSGAAAMRAAAIYLRVMAWQSRTGDHGSVQVRVSDGDSCPRSGSAGGEHGGASRDLRAYRGRGLYRGEQQI